MLAIPFSILALVLVLALDAVLSLKPIVKAIGGETLPDGISWGQLETIRGFWVEETTADWRVDESKKLL